ncbi:hypothetical protein DAEQUDRAFT_770138 [Daedalea quercina L-15889]|uniref:Uncharacterized protein n=1 Tax=Daedalea quercina L-15889 TaxID=1314783 RepID=A0A165L4H3_9APHY|nr:hypothetical protein DAEQUDRAFT_770138 [Daedalea quercina L-15889]
MLKNFAAPTAGKLSLYVVVGAQSSPSTFRDAKRMGKRIMTELKYIVSLLGERADPAIETHFDEERAAEAETGTGPSRTSSEEYESDSQGDYPSRPRLGFPRIREFLWGGGIKLQNDKLEAYDRGGCAFQSDVDGENIVDLLQEFEDWLLEDMDDDEQTMF